MLSVEDWAEIRRLRRAEGLPIKAIVRVLGVSRNTVRAAIASDVPPKYERTAAGSIVDEVEPRIRELLQAYPRMPATVIAERIGWTRGLTVFKERVAELRPAYLPPDPASRTSYVAGEIAQCDLWFPPIHAAGRVRTDRRPAQLPVLTMITGYSRWLSALLIPSRSAADLFAGWWQLIQKLAAVPRTLVWDGEGAIGRSRAGKVELTGECQAFRGTLGPLTSPDAGRGRVLEDLAGLSPEHDGVAAHAVGDVLALPGAAHVDREQVDRGRRADARWELDRRRHQRDRPPQHGPQHRVGVGPAGAGEPVDVGKDGALLPECGLSGAFGICRGSAVARATRMVFGVLDASCSRPSGAVNVGLGPGHSRRGRGGSAASSVSAPVHIRRNSSAASGSPPGRSGPTVSTKAR